MSKAHIDDIQNFSSNLQNECAKLANERTRLLEVKKDLTLQRDRFTVRNRRHKEDASSPLLRQLGKETLMYAIQLSAVTRTRAWPNMVLCIEILCTAKAKGRKF